MNTQRHSRLSKAHSSRSCHRICRGDLKRLRQSIHPSSCPASVTEREATCGKNRRCDATRP